MISRILVGGASRVAAMMLLVAAAGCDESLLEPRSPEAVFIPQRSGDSVKISERLPEPAAQDDFWHLVRRTELPAHAPPKYVMLAHTRSLGFIGDNPIGDWAAPPPYAAEYGHAPLAPWAPGEYGGGGW